MGGTQILHNQRKTGIEFLTDIPWGTHISAFYQTKQDLVNILTQYYRAGLENNEYCMWVVSDPLTPVEAEQALRECIPNFSSLRGQIEILPHTEWYLKYGDFNGDYVLNGWINKVTWALAQGYEGIRICGSTTWLKKRYWKTFMDYEARVEQEIGSLKMIALCTYQLDKCGIHEVLDIVSNHQFSFIHSQNDWQHAEDIVKFEQIGMVGQLASSIAHEIRNPMTSIRGFLQLLQAKHEFSAYTDYFSLMIDELDRVNGIITEYLSLAKTKPLNLKKQSLNQVLLSLLPLIQAHAIKEDKIVILETGNVEEVFMDSNDIRQVVLNLTRNGLEAMTNGGILRLKTYIEENKVVLSISDTGSGIPENIIHSLGTPFLTSKDNGTGLGLSVCYSILQRHNAEISVESSPTGTTFFIHFPVGCTKHSTDRLN